MEKRLEQLGVDSSESGERRGLSSMITKPRAMVAAAAMLIAKAAACSGDKFEIGDPADAGAEGGAGGEGGSGEGDSSDGGTDGQFMDAGIDGDADAGPQSTLSNAAGENECIHWLTSNAGVTQAFASDNHTCLPKPLSSIPINYGEFIYIWSKDAPSNSRIHVTVPFNVQNYFTKCSAHSVPPNKKEMETELLNGGLTPATNTVALPEVIMTNGSCGTNGSVYVIEMKN